MALVDRTKCDQPGSAYQLVNGQCIARFSGIAVPASESAGPLAAQRAQGAPRPLATPTLDRFGLFNWASGAYPGFFSGSYFDDSIYLPGFGTFYYRYYYGTGNYLAVLGNAVYVYGPMSAYTIYYSGLLSDFTCYVYDCNAGSALAVGSSVSSGFYTSNGYTEHTVYLYAGTSYTFNLVGGTLYDPYLELYNPYATLSASDDDNGDGLNSRIVHTAGYTGYYILRASSYASGTGSYTLSAAYTGGSTTGSLSVGSSVNSGFYTSNGYTDHTIYLAAGTSYTFSLLAGTLSDPYLELYNPYGSLSAYDDDSGAGLNSQITFTPTYTGTHTLRAQSYGTGYGSYTLSAAYTSSSGGSGSYITWTNSDNGVVVKDSSNEDFAFDSSSRCLYSYVRNEITSNFCLYPGSASGSFAGQSVTVVLVAALQGGCIAALADPNGYQIDIYTENGIQYVTTTNSTWDRTGCS